MNTIIERIPLRARTRLDAEVTNGQLLLIWSVTSVASSTPHPQANVVWQRGICLGRSSLLLIPRSTSLTTSIVDYDAFYASVVEHEDPNLKSVPLIIQQKQIVCTCNYKARERGVYKLQLMTEALKTCPEAVVVLGEDLTRFRNASKLLYNFLKDQIWSGRAERLGFDEVWLDVTDMVEHNISLLSPNDLQNSFFCLDRNDPTVGFAFDASSVFGPTWPPGKKSTVADEDSLDRDAHQLELRLVLGSQLARHLRHELEERYGFTATVGISTNKTLSKLVGNTNKPRAQTTLVPPYEPVGSPISTVTQFMDGHDIGKVPGIGFKLAQKIRAKVLGRTAEIDEGLVYGGTRESISVGDVRRFPGMSAVLLEEILGGPGAERGIGGRVHALLYGVDDAEVKKARSVPLSISQEDSYMRHLSSFDQVRQQLHLLAERLIRRMRVDLTEDDDEADEAHPTKRWLAHPKTLRLSTRPRPPTGPDGVRPRTFHRISKSAPLPNFVFSLTESTDALAGRLLESLITLFRMLHTERQGWNLSLINIAVTNMVEAKDGGRDIAKMMRNQEDVLKDFRVIESPADSVGSAQLNWDSDGSDIDDQDSTYCCEVCQATVPIFAYQAHDQFHRQTKE
ncbi:uncharacterized protein HMPREF1541_02368 [Cyphellophora europaea CBS 101466]|uniref:UmuC domain-containing protein n=1 Tax=Cyphellophora europaea (strain CBS 101466) TaxID=1220924 RepID=W2S5I1_CYPE1|nr:uncharacterized protein HMPREF1541_02368 [Cyphellophora europaea CBS 101466]ETN43209.1 hypothetical protein HMPREF1541_02368 [Cyphellophora europaea CBS 101466]